MARRSGRGETPEMVVDLLKLAVETKSQAEMSRILGVGVATINRFVHGIGEPTQETLERLADYFGKTVAELRGQELPDGMSEVLLEIYNQTERRVYFYKKFPDERDEVEADLALAENAAKWSVRYGDSHDPELQRIAKQLGSASERLKDVLENSRS